MIMKKIFFHFTDRHIGSAIIKIVGYDETYSVMLCLFTNCIENEEKLDDACFPRKYSRKIHISQIFMQYYLENFIVCWDKKKFPSTLTILIIVLQS